MEESSVYLNIKTCGLSARIPSQERRIPFSQNLRQFQIPRDTCAAAIPKPVSFLNKESRGISIKQQPPDCSKMQFLSYNNPTCIRRRMQLSPERFLKTGRTPL